jgi:hypothetical protein
MAMLSRQSLRITLYVVLWLALADLVIGRAFAPAGGRVNELQRYFEYGRSVEGKLAQMVSGVRDGRIVEAGWIDEAALRRQPSERAASTDLLLAAYGQSFTLNAVNRVAELDRGLTLRLAGGPGAPASHSYRTYMVDVDLRKADAVVFGVLSSTVGQMASISGLISMYGNPAPFTYPRYRLAGDRLQEELPVIDSEAAFREAFGTRSAKWQAFRNQLKSSDKGFDRFTFDESWIDASVVGRLLRRGWVAHKDSYDEGVYTPERGFNPDSEEVRVLSRLVVEADAMARSRGERFIVLLLHTKGHGDRLHQVLRGTLERHRIEYISSHDHFSANDPGMFLPDGHYVPRANDALAEALRQRLRQQPASR